MDKGRNSLYRIGDAARLTGTKTSQLRFYERLGILSPKYRDIDSEYRLYSYDQLMEIETIISLQSMGFTLKQIKTILSDRDNFLEQSCFLSEKRIEEVDAMIESLTHKRECMKVFNKLCSAFLSEYRLKNYTIESIPQHSVVLSGRHVRLGVDNDAKEMLTTMNLASGTKPNDSWYMSAYAYKVKLMEDNLEDMEAELCTILSVSSPSDETIEEPTRLYARTTQALCIDDIPFYTDKLLQLSRTAGLVPLPYYYVLLVAKDKSGHDRHIRQIRIPLESV